MNSHFHAALRHFKLKDPILHSAAICVEPFSLETSKEYFSELCKSIIYQQLSVLAGRSILNKFTGLFPKQTVTPEFLLKLKDENIRAAGISYPKIKYLKDLAEKIVSKEIMFENIQMAGEQEVIDSLTKVKGIGKWTAEMFLMFSLGRPDVFSPGDLGLRNAIKRLYRLENKPTMQQLLNISSKWSPYRTYASIILWKHKLN